MNNTIRLTLLLSVSALFATACTPVPFENQNTYSSTYTAPAPMPITTAANTAPVPEAGPLSTTPQTYAANTTPVSATVPVSNPAPIANTTPVATVPQVPAATHVAATTYTPPQATGGTAGAYNAYAANDTGGSAGTNYAYNTSGGNDSYTSYNTTNTPAANSNANGYYAAGDNTAYDTYNTDGGNNSYTAANTTQAGGTAAVQIFATVDRAKAERIRQDVRSQGLQAVVDQVDGLYKVRVPYTSSTQARANLIRVRSVSGTPGAFVTTR